MRSAVLLILYCTPIFATLNPQLSALLSTTPYQRSTVSIHVQSLKTKQVYLSKNPHTLFIPASLNKLLLSAASIDTLGLKHRFSTHIYLDKQQNLYIKGGGDPSLTSQHIQHIITKLKRKKITHINKIIIDNTYLAKSSNPFPNSAKFYHAKAESLNINDNEIQLSVFNNNQLKPIPQTNYCDLDLRNIIFSKQAQKTAPRINIYKRPKADKYIIRGIISQKNTPKNHLSVRVTRPALYFEILLKEQLTKNNISLQDHTQYKAITKKGKQLLLRIKSKPLIHHLQKLNKDSNNMLANCLIKHLGKENKHKPGSVKTGSKTIRQFIQNQLNIKKAYWKIVDGSGLSTKNQCSSKHIATLLQYIYKKKSQFNAIYNSLVNPQTDQTFADIDIPKHLEVRLKTGTLASKGVHNMAGYIRNTHTDDVIEFVIMLKSEETLYAKAELTNPILNNLLKTL